MKSELFIKYRVEYLFSIDKATNYTTDTQMYDWGYRDFDDYDLAYKFWRGNKEDWVMSRIYKMEDFTPNGL